MPYRMHSDYLRHLFLDNDLAEGRYRVEGKPVALSDIHAPMFVVGTLHDHVTPWQSTHKIHLLTDTDVAYVLTSGGHNAGIVAAPDEEGHSYQVMTKKVGIPMSDRTVGSSSRRNTKGPGGTSGSDSFRLVLGRPTRRHRKARHRWETRRGPTSCNISKPSRSHCSGDCLRGDPVVLSSIVTDRKRGAPA